MSCFYNYLLVFVGITIVLSSQYIIYIGDATLLSYFNILLGIGIIGVNSLIIGLKRSELK